MHEVCQHDLLVIPASESQWFKRILFGSLANGVTMAYNRPMRILYSPRS